METTAQTQVPNGIPRYGSLQRRGSWAITGLVLNAAMLTLVAVELLLVDRLNHRLQLGATIPQADIDQLNRNISMFGGLYSLSGYLAAGLFLYWLYRASHNLRRLSPSPPLYSVQWAMWCWFIPIANLTCPLYVMDEVWRLSDLDAPELEGAQQIPWQLRWWWGLWILAILCGLPLLFIDDSTVDGVRSASIWAAIRAAIVIADATFAGIIVVQINRRQAARYRRVSNSGATGAEGKSLGELGGGLQ